MEVIGVLVVAASEGPAWVRLRERIYPLVRWVDLWVDC